MKLDLYKKVLDIVVNRDKLLSVSSNIEKDKTKEVLVLIKK